MQGAWVPSLVRELIPRATSKDLVCLSITTIVVYSLSHVWFFCDPMDFSLPGSSVHRIFQARVLEWVVISYSKGSSWPMNWTHISCIGQWILYHWATWEAQLRPMQLSSVVAQPCPTLCDPVNRSTSGLPVYHQLLEFTQSHVHRVGDAIQPSHPLSSPSPPAPNPSQHQSLFQWVNSLHEVAKVLEFQL